MPLPVDGSHCREYAGPALLFQALSSHPVCFASPASDVGWPDTFRNRVRRHRCGAAEAVTVDALTSRDLPALRSMTCHALLTRPNSITLGFPDADLADQLAAAGFKLFFPTTFEGRIDTRNRHFALISSVEFLFSDNRRLHGYPLLGGNATLSEGEEPQGRRRAVVLLDLLQDFEILRPLLARAAAVGSPFEMTVAVTQRFAKSHLGELVSQFLQANEIPFFTPVGAIDVATALGENKALLLTAAESSAAPHVFAHTCCRLAPPRTLRVTIQHGLECVGLRHHRAHDFDFPHGVRFGSDVVLTWDHVEALPNLHPADVDKCVPVGVVKATAERCAALAESRWLNGSSGQRDEIDADKLRLLVAENLHSVRFKAPERYQRFLAFIDGTRRNHRIDLTMRSHPASRILEKKAESNRLQFLHGILRADDLARFHQFVSPPSTVVLDAVCAGVASAVWSDAPELGDTMHYRGLPVVADDGDLQRLLRDDVGMRAFQGTQWAVGATAALNGVPAAWNKLCQLMA
jgi:hypothetical protein